MRAHHCALAGSLAVALLSCAHGAVGSDEPPAVTGESSLGVRARQAGDLAPGVVPPYPFARHVARQNLRLRACRQELKPDFDFDRAAEFALYTQGVAIICELAAQERGLGDNPAQGEVGDDEIDALMRRLVTRLAEGIGLAGSPDDWRPPCVSDPEVEGRLCFGNIVIARYAAFFAAYAFGRFPAVAWQPATRDAAHALFAEGNWYPWAGTVSNSTLPLVAMRLFAGDALDDPALFEVGRSQLYACRDQVPREGLAEPMAPHYAGMTLTVLAMIADLPSPEIRGLAEDLLAVSLLVPAHLYLPGGGLGAPQQREKTGGGIADPDPTAADHLIPALNMLVYDPELRGAGHPPYGLATSYRAPEIIRSIFLEKGPGYTFEYRARSPRRGEKETGWYPGRRSYRSLGAGTIRAEPGGVRVSPWAAVMLPEGRAQMGVMYGSGGSKSNSAGLYVRRPGPTRGGQQPDFSILYQHQPRRPARSFVPRDYEPLEEDPTWHWERKSGSRRMLYRSTAIALFESLSDRLIADRIPYTMVHLPDFADPEVGDGMLEVPSSTLVGSSWFVGRSGSAYVAYLPLGRIAKRQRFSDENGSWIYLQLRGAVSGGITELATTSSFPSLADYAADLRSRHVAFLATGAEDAWAEVDARSAGGTARIRLDFWTDRRSIDGVPQADADFLALRDMMRSPFVRWDDDTFTLTVARNGYPPLILRFGDPRVPTAPRRPTLEMSGGTVHLGWRHGFDDVGITAYDVYRNDRLIGTVDGSVTRFVDERPVFGTDGVARYSLSSRDADGNVSPVRARGLDVRRFVRHRRQP